MPRQPYTVLLYSTHALVADEVVLDPAYDYVLRSINVFYPSDLGGSLQIVDGDSATIFEVQVPPASNGQWGYHDTRIALRSGDTLALYGINGPDVYLTAYKFLLPV